MNLTQRNLVLLVVACGLAVPTFLQLRADQKTFVDIADIPLMFDGFTSDNASVIRLAKPKAEQPAAEPGKPQRIAYDTFQMQAGDKGWVIATSPGQVPGSLVGAKVQERMLESEVFHHLRSIRSDEKTLVQPDATPEQLAQYGLDEAHAFVVQVLDKGGRNLVAELMVGNDAGVGQVGTEAVRGVFVRKQGSNDVVLYELEKPWRRSFEKSQWVDLTLVRLEPTKVRKISIQNASTRGRPVVFERPRGQASWTCKQPPEGRGAVRQTEVEGLLQPMRYLSAKSFVRPESQIGNAAGLGLFPPQIEIKLEIDDPSLPQVTLQVGHRLDDKNDFYLLCSESNFLMTWGSSTVTRFELDVAQRMFDPKPQ